MADFSEQIYKAFELTAKRLFSDIPNNDAKYSYADDKTSLPQILKGGDFAAPSHVQSFDPHLIGSFASVGINALWRKSNVFIAKISSQLFGSDLCSPPLFDNQAWCDENKVLHVLMTFTPKWPHGSIYDPRLGPRGGILNPVYKDSVDTAVPGFEHLASDDFLKGMTVEKIVKASETGGAIPNATPDGALPADFVTSEKLQTIGFDLPFCDLDGLLNPHGLKNICKNKPALEGIPTAGGDKQSWEDVSFPTALP